MRKILSFVVDLGTSSIKVLWSIGDKRGFEFLLPYVCDLSQKRYRLLLEQHDQVSNQNSVISYQIDGEEYFKAMGPIAHSGGQTLTHVRKQDDAIARILSVLSKVLHQLDYQNDGIDLQIRVLLPLDEYPDRQQLGQKLRQALEGWAYDGQWIDGLTSTIKIFPEGYGLSLSSNGTELNDEQVPVLMIGHADLAWLRFGTNESVVQAGCGMTLFMQALREYRVIDDELTTMTAIATGRHKDLLPDKGNFEALAELEQAIAYAREDWVNQSKIRSLPFNEISSPLAVGGGGASFMRQEIKALIPKKVSILNLKPIRSKCQETFPDMEPSLVPLFLDCYQNFVRMQWVPRSPSPSLLPAKVGAIDWPPVE